MPEMAPFCGKTFTVDRRAEKTCVEGVGLRSMRNAEGGGRRGQSQAPFPPPPSFHSPPSTLHFFIGVVLVITVGAWFATRRELVEREPPPFAALRQIVEASSTARPCSRFPAGSPNAHTPLAWRSENLGGQLE